MRRAVRNLIRLIASGLFLFGGFEFALAYLRLQAEKPSLLHFIFGGILTVAGVFLFLASASLAEQLTDDFEE